MKQYLGLEIGLAGNISTALHTYGMLHVGYSDEHTANSLPGSRQLFLDVPNLTLREYSSS
jgi:hypothetical protein